MIPMVFSNLLDYDSNHEDFDNNDYPDEELS